MSEPLYPPLTANQKAILEAVRGQGRLHRKQISALLGVDQREANNEISSLVIRGALVADGDSDIFALGKEAEFWMSPAAKKGACGKVCPSCGVNPCSKPAGHGGMCYCSDCRYGD
ncbi:MAG: hypothetical protein ACM359_17205 [Bacillota bacterium]